MQSSSLGIVVQRDRKPLSQYLLRSHLHATRPRGPRCPVSMPLGDLCPPGTRDSLVPGTSAKVLLQGHVTRWSLGRPQRCHSCHPSLWSLSSLAVLRLTCEEARAMATPHGAQTGCQAEAPWNSPSQTTGCLKPHE